MLQNSWTKAQTMQEKHDAPHRCAYQQFLICRFSTPWPDFLSQSPNDTRQISLMHVYVLNVTSRLEPEGISNMQTNSSLTTVLFTCVCCLQWRQSKLAKRLQALHATASPYTVKTPTLQSEGFPNASKGAASDQHLLLSTEPQGPDEVSTCRPSHL